MNDLDKLLEYVKRTNPEMDRQSLIEKLNECSYSAFALIFTFENSCITSE